MLNRQFNTIFIASILIYQITVDIRTSIISVGDIDTVSQQFKCDFYLSATWKEPQLQGRRKEVRLQVVIC